MILKRGMLVQTLHVNLNVQKVHVVMMAVAVLVGLAQTDKYAKESNV
jgi:hypothetical protein